MAISFTRCPKCGKSYRDDRASCPHCSPPEPKERGRLQRFITDCNGQIRSWLDLKKKKILPQSIIIVISLCIPIIFFHWLSNISNQQIAQPLPKQSYQESRDEKIKKQFSAWDGSHIKLTEYIKGIMNDPDSYQHVETKYWDKGDYLIVFTQFRGKNMFGGVVKNGCLAKVSINGNILHVFNQDEVMDFINGKKSLDDY